MRILYDLCRTGYSVPTIMKEKDNFENYSENWKEFRETYDFLGPDPQIIY